MKTIIGKDCTLAKEFLLQGLPIGFPTETVYGLAANGLNLNSISKIFEIKKRPTFNPLILHVDDISKFLIYCLNIPEKAKILAEKLTPGPITFLLPKHPSVPDLVTAGSSLVALRIPLHPLALELLSHLPFPLAAPSANPFGYISPTCAQHVKDQLDGKIPYILDGDASCLGIESTIIGFENEDAPCIYRLGSTPVEEITKWIGPVTVMTHSSSKPLAPGQLTSHYAPKKPFIVGSIPELIAQYANKKLAILSFCKIYDTNIPHLVLAPDNNLFTAAKNLFAYMRKLDQASVDLILAEFVPHEDIGKAINDRLKRASFS